MYPGDETHVSLQDHLSVPMYLFGTGTTEITHKDLGEDETILLQVIVTARVPRRQKDLTHYKNESGCLSVNLPWIHLTVNMDNIDHISCSGDTTGISPRMTGSGFKYHQLLRPCRPDIRGCGRGCERGPCSIIPPTCTAAGMNGWRDFVNQLNLI